MMLDEGLNKIKDLVEAEFTQSTAGTGSTTESTNDTGLANPDDNTTREITWTKTDKQIDYEAEPVGTTGDGNTYTEFMIKNSAEIIGERIVFSDGILKDNTFGIRIDGGFFIESI